jgi:hypothetical protein
VYNFNWEEDVADRKDRCVKYSITSSHPSSQNYSRQVFFGSEQTVPSQYAIEDVEIDAGFPSNCTPDRYGSTLILLEPDMRMADLFYPIASGQLLVPHRFWVLQNEHHCIEDFFLDGNFIKVFFELFFIRFLNCYLFISRLEELRLFVRRTPIRFQQVPLTILENYN